MILPTLRGVYSSGVAYVIPALAGWAISGATFTRNGSSFDLTFDRTQYLPATTRDYYVKPTGSTGNNGLSWATAKQTIGQVIGVANAGGFFPRIYLEGGGSYQNSAVMPNKIQLIGVDQGSGAQVTLTQTQFVTNGTYATNCYVENANFRTLVNSSAGTRMFKGCNFQWGTASANGSGDNTLFTGTGIVICENCTASNSVSGDGYNYNNTLSAFEINCTSSNNGVDAADNGSTAHQSVKIIRYGCTYINNWRNVHDVNEVKSYLIDCTINTSKGLDGGIAYNSFNVGSGQTGTAETTVVSIYGGNVSGGSVVDLFCDTDGVMNVSNLTTYSTSSGTITPFTI